MALWYESSGRKATTICGQAYRKTRFVSGAPPGMKISRVHPTHASRIGQERMLVQHCDSPAHAGRIGVARRFNGGERKAVFQSRFAGRLAQRGISIPPAEGILSRAETSSVMLNPLQRQSKRAP